MAAVKRMKDGGEKKRRDRWMLLALFGILILVDCLAGGKQSKEADNQCRNQWLEQERESYNYAEQYAAEYGNAG
ncbi:MAG: hypothetical protein ACLR1V_08610 [Coprococcus sp.]